VRFIREKGRSKGGKQGHEEESQKIMKGVSSRTVGGETYCMQPYQAARHTWGKGMRSEICHGSKAKEVLSKHETRDCVRSLMSSGQSS